MPNISQALDGAIAIGLDRLDAQLLLSYALQPASAQPSVLRAWLLAHSEDEIAPCAQSRFNGHVQRRAAGEPLAYITGHKEFFGLSLQIDPRVLIPRPDTETLVLWALEILASPARRGASSPQAVLDLGTGSGAIALALKHTLPHLLVDALDVSAGALAVAQANARRLDLRVQFSLGNWLDQVTRQYDCIVANPPYVAAKDPHLVALAHEPAMALVSGHDGLQDIRHIVRAAAARLYPGAWLLIEHGFDQAAAARELFLAAGYQEIMCRRDLGGNQRCTGGRKT